MTRETPHLEADIGSTLISCLIIDADPKELVALCDRIPVPLRTPVLIMVKAAVSNQSKEEEDA